MGEQNTTNVIQLDGCLPFLGCTIMLSGPDMQELKLVKHALKKILRMSRQLILENEYYTFLELQSFNFSKSTDRDHLSNKELTGDLNSLKQDKPKALIVSEPNG